ncbi:conserved Plasmodium protein, unknown function [Plasmodium ovale wallikeri]|uniref:Uncharacterized protein n=2 Tax=Plasmodium ovale TaxID=36330 RepID=A0A1A8ZSA3_PLAOA|nr:conserved Plasmodium protein, unknown function [Plasmodium ovale wallikeri]SBT47166.1 conserved Plasmodium protein, unknown function [Plasmodium ovale wallikeri]SBT79037.1 conserved Plasmodium protein, unknown function [Plasmodium ovale]
MQCLRFLNFFKAKKILTGKKSHSKRHCSSGLPEKKKKINTHISYAVPYENVDQYEYQNEHPYACQKKTQKYNFEVLMKAIKNRADEYNLIKIKEVQGKILIHLNKFTINEVVSTLILSFQNNFLNAQLLSKITEHLFRNSFFLNSKHLYILVSVARKFPLHEEDFSQNEEENTYDIHKKEQFMQDVSENIRWKEKYQKEVQEIIFLDETVDAKLERTATKQLDDHPEKKSPPHQSIIEYLHNDEIKNFQKQRNEESIMSITQMEKIPKGKHFQMINLTFCEEETCTDATKIFQKIKNILYHNFNSIYMNIKGNMYTNLLLLNYLHEENIITKKDFLKILYSINLEFDQDSFHNDMNKSGETSSYADNIANLYIQEEGKNVTTCDLYTLLHFNLLKNVLKKNDFIDEHFLLEKIDNDIAIDEEAYEYKNTYLLTFSSFFHNLINIKGNINSVKVFYLNILTYEICKKLNDNENSKNIKINYLFLKNVKVEYILKGDTQTDIDFFFLSILYYLQRKGMLKYNMCLFDNTLSDIKKVHRNYVLFLNSLKTYNLYQIFPMADHANTIMTTPRSTHLKSHSPLSKNRNKPKEDKKDNLPNHLGNDELRDTFFCHFMVEFTFNVICNLNRRNIYEQLFILKYVIHLNFKNEYLIDIINNRLHNFFMVKSHYTDVKNLFYFLEYLLISLSSSPHIFFNTIYLMNCTTFYNLLGATGQKKDITSKAKNIYDTLNGMMNAHQIRSIREEKKLPQVQQTDARKSNPNKHDTAMYNMVKIQAFQNVLYDFLFL